jgi:NAD(P)-dependent dehydrogenase (short-subunit alcohol dehydrogenase family)
MDLELKDKVVLVTGGSKGIGRAIVESFIGEGARVVNVNRAGSDGPALGDELSARGCGEQYAYFPADLTQPEASQQAVEFTLARFGRLDLLVNNAGVNDSVGIEDGPDRFLESLRRNLLHFYALVHHAQAELRRRRGAIINIGSKVSVTGQGHTSAYAAAKGAINSLTREWAVDFADDQVRVNTVIPAETWTPLYDRLLKQLPDPAAAKTAIEQLIPLGRRFTTCREIADMVVFLASARSSHTTGQIIFVDGGYTHLDRKCTR